VLGTVEPSKDDNELLNPLIRGKVRPPGRLSGVVAEVHPDVIDEYRPVKPVISIV
jgi:hypothetical protein